ncbi:hypothetical protein BDB01DRAFT_778921 [Pilobolus umbonatus]|nr:hypothetical protein BDB01DRAFT_778921 [Pilobolus umbonatus]
MIRNTQLLKLGNIARSIRYQHFQAKKPCYFQHNRTYIRPHYYNNSLSDSIKRQNSLFHQIGRRINNIEPNKILWSLIGTNVTVFLLWQYAINSYKQFGDDSWLTFMSKNFVASGEAVSGGRIHTLLTSTISHMSLNHLGINMLVLYSMGQGVIEAIGASRFLLLYGGAGITASIVAIGYRQYIRPLLKKDRGYVPRNNIMGSLGASGSIMGVTTLFACAFPKAKFLVFFIIPMPAVAVVGLFAAYDIYQASTMNVSNRKRSF